MSRREEGGCHMGCKPEASPSLIAGLLSIKQMFLEIPQVLSKFTLCKSYGNLNLIPHSKVSVLAHNCHPVPELGIKHRL